MRRRAVPYCLMGPGTVWLVLFFVIPLYFMGRLSLSRAPSALHFAWDWANYSDALSRYDTQFVRSFIYAGSATAIALVLAYPLAYAIAFRGALEERAAVRGRRPVLHHLPDPDDRLDDDPLRQRPRRRRAEDVRILAPSGRLLATGRP